MKEINEEIKERNEGRREEIKEGRKGERNKKIEEEIK